MPLPPQRGHRRARGSTERDSDTESNSELPAPPRKRVNVTGGRRLRTKTSPSALRADAREKAQERANYAESAFFSAASCPDQVLEIQFPFIEGDRGIRKYLRNPEAFVVT
jgi:hypothetical protein